MGGSICLIYIVLVLDWVVVGELNRLQKSPPPEIQHAGEVLELFDRQAG